jgi:hypothetical protein
MGRERAGGRSMTTPLEEAEQLQAEIAGRRRAVLRRIGRRLVEIGRPTFRDAISAMVADGDRGVAVTLLVAWRSKQMLRVAA